MVSMDHYARYLVSENHTGDFNKDTAFAQSRNAEYFHIFQVLMKFTKDQQK